jgi:hypothetical protein
MMTVKRAIVDGLESACRATRVVEWIPGWHRIYPQCLLARWSSHLDYIWRTGHWPVHDEDGFDAWAEWYESLREDELVEGHWHHW